MIRHSFIDPPHQLADLVRKSLDRHLSTTGRRITTDVYDQDVVLTGVVSSWYQKQVAQESVLAIDGVDVVDNRLIVDYENTIFEPIG